MPDQPEQQGRLVLKPIQLCFISLVLLTLAPACKRGELSETLAWMDNTYNPHKGVTGAFGHVRTGWYAANNPSRQTDEYLVSGSTETFTHDGCQITLHIEENPYASAHREMNGTFVSTFNLRDINSQSIKVSTFSHRGGLRCDDYKPEEQQLYEMNCDHAEITFSTRSEAPLINEESHITFEKLQGSDHESKSKSKGARAYFE